MKPVSLFCILPVLVLFNVSCTKNKEVIACAAIIALPNINFQLKDKTDGSDLFFAPAPKYTADDIRIFFKNSTNKPDSTTPYFNSEINISGTTWFTAAWLIPATLK